MLISFEEHPGVLSQAKFEMILVSFYGNAFPLLEKCGGIFYKRSLKPIKEIKQGIRLN